MTELGGPTSQSSIKRWSACGPEDLLQPEDLPPGSLMWAVGMKLWFLSTWNTHGEAPHVASLRPSESREKSKKVATCSSRAKLGGACDGLLHVLLVTVTI